MELVIKIPEDYYKAIKEIPAEQSTADMLIIRNGTPLKGGHWIEHINGCLECSICNCVPPCNEFADKIIWKKWKFCPECGTRMESEE